ncbi:MAG: UbiA family prenyltransferase, partial [Eggerthellaceae bacterium]|nr:UbiA family prenyltransferase [Eggerthellaceae bacterium]
LKEMLPPYKAALVAVVLFFEIYFLIIFISESHAFNVGLPEAVGCITIFVFLLTLRIADDLKDFKTDAALFPGRPLPSGRVLKKDVITLLVASNVVTLVLNLLFMNNLLFYAILMAYAALMSVWFFARSKIQKSLMLALVTHNPVGMVMIAYIISFTCFKYGYPLFSVNNLLILFTLYWPTLIWEIARKTRAPKDETEYTTYSKLFGYRKVTALILGIVTCDVVTSAILMFQLWGWGVIAAVAAYVWFAIECLRFMRNPESFKLVSKVELYELVTEAPVILIEMAYVLRWLG